jgi:hypothetical protein
VAVRTLVLLALAVAAGFVALMLWTTHGHFVAPITDFYVIAQYARAMAEGHPFQYNAGEPATTGATSLLLTALLALGHAAGARGEWLVAFAVCLGAAFLVASVALAVRLATRLGGPREGWLAGALVALGGPVAWGYLYGSDVALAMLLALFVLERWLAYWQGEPGVGLGAATCLLALARPEGLPIALLLGLASLGRPAASASRRERPWPWLGVAAGLLVLLLQRALTGAWLGTSVSEKALLPNYGPVETLALASKYGVDVLRGLLLGFYPAESPIGFSQGAAAFAFPPLGLLLVLLAAVRPAAAVRGAARAWLAVVAVVFALTGPNVFMGVHFNRYLLWAFPGLLAYAAVGLGVATRLLAREDAALERGLFRAGAGLWLLLALLSTARFGATYAEMAGETWRREIPMAEWIRANLPPGVAIANAATSIEYLTGHRNLNLHGVTSAAFVGTRTADREAGMFESLVRLPRAARPPFLLLNRSTYEGSPLFQALAEGTPLFQTASLGDDLLLFRARWELLDRGARPLLPEAAAATAALTLEDRLNVCDSRDEADHHYTFESRAGEVLLGGSVEIDPAPGAGGEPLADGGRLIVGHESFRVRTRGGRELVIVLRTHSSTTTRLFRSPGPSAVPVEVDSAGIVVRAGGRPVAQVTLPNRQGWNEHVLRLPASAVGEGETSLELSGRYASFQYWFYQ